MGWDALMSDGVLVVTRRSQLAELWDSTWWRLLVFVAASVLLGAVGAQLWARTSPSPIYVIQDDLTALMSERGQAAIIGVDASFTLITAVIGFAVGLAGWFVLYRRGWLVIAGALVAAVAATLMTWQLGLTVGVNGFAGRLASAVPGDVVPVDLELRSLSALMVAPFAAITPVMLLAAFWPERQHEQHHEDQAPTQ